MSETVAETYTAAENKFRIEMLDLSLEELKAAIQLFLAAPAGLAKGAIRA